MDTKAMEYKVLTRCQKEGWELHPQKDLNKLVEEMGEVSREVRRLEDGRERPDEKEPEREVILKHLAEEVGDMLFPMIKILLHYGLTLEDAYQAHADKMEKRYGGEDQHG